MTSIAASKPQVERRKASRGDQPKDYGWTTFMIVITVVMLAGFFISYDHLYKPGDNIGYNLGLVGGIMMATLLFYPLRKRIGFMKSWGLLPKWFKWHMAFGVLGPLLIIYHSTFTMQSINAAVAMICMLLVSGSGIFGRFFYTKIHHGLYGRQSSFDQLKANLEGKGDVKSILAFAPELERKLIEFRDGAMAATRPGKLDLVNFLKLGFKAKWYSRVFVRELEDVMYAPAIEKQWSDVQMKRLDELFYQNERFIRTYLLTIRDLAQFSTYEKLFSLWHVFHVPLVYMLVFSSIWHVIAVHQY